MRRWLTLPIRDCTSALDHLARSRHAWRALALSIGSMIATWFLYVPVHELLHAYGCLWTGGSVQRLEISPWYGGGLLARWFPFITSGSDYAGRLSGFCTEDSDGIYLATVFAPFLLTVMFGVVLLRMAATRYRPICFGAGIAVGLAPFTNLIGDYYEMGSIITTRALTVVAPESLPETSIGTHQELVADRNEEPADVQDCPSNANGATLASVRSDDVFKLAVDIFAESDRLGLRGAGAKLAAMAVMLVSFALALMMAFATYALGHLVAVLWIGPVPDKTPPA